MNVPLSSLRIVRVVVARVGSGVGEVGGVTGVIGEAAIGGILADGKSHAAAMTSKTIRAVKRRITSTPFRDGRVREITPWRLKTLRCYTSLAGPVKGLLNATSAAAGC